MLNALEIRLIKYFNKMRINSDKIVRVDVINNNLSDQHPKGSNIYITFSIINIMEFMHKHPVIEKLNNNHPTEVFNCGNEDLNNFLIDDSMDQMKSKVNVTYVCKYNKEIAAYFTVSADSIRIKDISDEDKELLINRNITYRSLPALKLGRLAVDKKFQNQGIGTVLLSRIILQALELSKKIGLRFIIVDAYKKSLNFYEKKFYFVTFPKYKNKIQKIKETSEESDTIQIYFDLIRG